MSQINMNTSLEILEKLRTQLGLASGAVIFEKAETGVQLSKYEKIKRNNYRSLLLFFFPPEDRYRYIRTKLIDEISQDPPNPQVLAENLNTAYDRLLQDMANAWTECRDHLRNAIEHTKRMLNSEDDVAWKIDWRTVRKEYIDKLDEVFGDSNFAQNFWAGQKQLEGVPCSVPVNVPDDWLHSVVALIFICLAMLPSGADEPSSLQQQFASALADEIRRRFCPEAPTALQEDNRPAPLPENPPEAWPDIVHRQDKDDYANIDMLQNTKVQVSAEYLENKYMDYQESLLVESIEYAPATNVYDFLNANHHDNTNDNHRTRATYRR